MEKSETSRHKFVIFVIIFILPTIFCNVDIPCNCTKTGEGKIVVKCVNFREVSDILCSENYSFEDVESVDLSNNQLNSTNFTSVNNFTSLLSLNLSYNILERIDLRREKFPKLQKLDLSHNKLTKMPEKFFLNNKNLEVIGLEGNPWDTDILTWFIDWARQNKDKIQNKDNITYVFNGTTNNLWEMVDSCPDACSCFLYDNHNVLQVDCNGRGLEEFPDRIPNRTRSLHLENNKITNFRVFIKEVFYKEITEVYLDNNLISSLSELDGIRDNKGYRLSTLGLSGNRLSQLSPHIVIKFNLFLGGNPWLCDCKSGAKLRNLTIDRLRHIHDLINISCGEDSPQHANKKLSHLSHKDLCYVENSEFHVLDVVNAILGILIVVVLTKLLYDWWHFKRTGKLPMGPFEVLQVWNKKRFRLTNVPD